MSFEINGNQGKYDNTVVDPSVRYGRNAVNNNMNYMKAPIVNDKPNPAPILDFMPDEKGMENNIKSLEKFIENNDAYLKSLPPLDFEYRYMPKPVNGEIDRNAVLGAAYEEMGTASLPVQEFENRYLIDDSMTAKPLDINKDGKIDISEYGANIVAADVLSKGTTDVTKADGTINAEGLNKILEYTKKINSDAAAKLYADVYNTYSLGKNLDSFKAE